ncbi:cupin domain-containing protein [Variovorax sp. PBL-E5]|uniref:cupin domain-containing protein n=1 Tax=Variovorax sp. PBL-E5 TaxID=434014 RepID=UPI001318FEC7|nr:cupin domain-containing protein [Variovorax sp. PBL-E5]VTU26894.1 putative mannose-6-phosphate isomerase [Variovorax sp. PBL-E5]
MQSASTRSVTAISPDRKVLTSQGLPYFIGISGHSAGALGLSMHLVVIPPGARSEPHLHEGHETAIYVLQGRVETLYGDGLAQSVISEAGDFLFIPPDVPHVAINLSATEPARAIVSRNDPAEQDKVRPYRMERRET